MCSIVWFRHDLRLHDQPAFARALELGEPVVPVYVWSPEEERDWAPGGATKWWLHRSLQSLAKSLENLGLRLILRNGTSHAETGDKFIESGNRFANGLNSIVR